MPHTADHYEDDHVDDGAPAVTRSTHDPMVREERHETYRSDAPVAGAHDYSLAGRINTVLFAVLVALEGLLTLRFALVAFGANRDSGFVDFIMDVSWPFVRPFDGAFANRTWDEGIIEVSTLLAMGVYALAFAIVAMLISALLPRMTSYDRSERIESRSVTHGGH